MKHINKNMSGFTIFELLIVISIISAILIMGLNNYSNVQKKARDTRRKSDLKQIQKALELYRQDQNPPSYPITGSLPSANSCWSSAASCTGNVYMNKMPGDPNRVVSDYGYKTSLVLPISTYVLCACLENPSDPDGSSGNCDDTSYICSSNIKYELTQP